MKKFNPPPGWVTGVIGGPPCQNFSGANRNPDYDAGMVLVNEYLRIVTAANPEWALMENVAGSPDVTSPGYVTQRFTLDASQLGSDQHRLRKFHFFHRPGTAALTFQRDRSHPGTSQPTCMASEGRRVGKRSWAEFCRLQGLPDGFDLEPFKVTEKYKAVGNGVPYPMAIALATAIVNRSRAVTPHRLCECGCGEYVTGKERLASPACRKREQRKRDAVPTAAGSSQLTLV